MSPSVLENTVVPGPFGVPTDIEDVSVASWGSVSLDSSIPLVWVPSSSFELELTLRYLAHLFNKESLGFSPEFGEEVAGPPPFPAPPFF